MEGLPAAADPDPKQGTEAGTKGAGRYRKGRKTSTAPARDIQDNDQQTKNPNVTVAEAAESAGSPPSEQTAAAAEHNPSTGAANGAASPDEADEEHEVIDTEAQRKRHRRSASASRMSEQTTDVSTAAEAPEAAGAAAAGAGTSGDAAADGSCETGHATNLNDADCTPGTAEFAAAKSEIDKTLATYQHRVSALTKQERCKPDMIAHKELRSTLTPDIRFGHMPGVRVGDEFVGRGELAILGLHVHMMRGIMSFTGGKPAYAICLAGGYKDDTDEGSTFWYTGQGGQEKGKQVKDQSFETADNAALKRNAETKTPVRVFRAKVADKDGKVERKYVYEGLYWVTDCQLVKSKDGPKVCRFKMEAVPGHSTVSGKVDFRVFSKNPFRVRNLANTAASKPGKKRSRPLNTKLYTRKELEAMIAKRAAAGKSGRLVNSDLAGGQEKIPIPVWNEIDDDDAILMPVEGEEPEQFQYIADYKFGEESAKDLAVAAEQKFQASCTTTCGIEFGGGKKNKGYVNYNGDRLMMCTHPCGIMECDEKCRCFRGCKDNNVVSSGLRYPLEVYKVSQDKRWGVRCAVDLPIGAVVCCYIGLLITDEWADQLRNQDLYLFDLDHFQQLADAEDKHELPDEPMNPHLPPVPQEYRNKHLVIDAHKQGNVARFINHGCDPNCLIQAVFAGYARSHLLYYIAIVASKDIPKNTELTYDYGYSRLTRDPNSTGEGRIKCTCGAANCPGWLIK